MDDRLVDLPVVVAVIEETEDGLDECESSDK
jgi:hypothetical protein